MILLPKEFNIDISKIDKRFAVITSSNYDGVVKSGDNFTVQWKTTPSDNDLAAIELYWRNLTQQVYNTPTAEESTAALAAKLDVCMQFGKALVVEVAIFNIQMGITQAGKTRAVADYTQKLQNYLASGSLYAAVEEITALKNDITRPLLNLDPYITNDRLDIYKNKILTFLSTL